MSEPVNHLRDARLHQALSHAPDAQTLPSAVTRNAIKNIATNAIAESAAGHVDFYSPWWKKLWQTAWQGSGRARNPWNAAFATIVLSSLITLIWFQKEVPDAVPDEQPQVAYKAPQARRADPVAAAPEVASARPAAPVVAQVAPPPSLGGHSATGTPTFNLVPKMAKALPDSSPGPKPADEAQPVAAGVVAIAPVDSDSARKAGAGTLPGDTVVRQKKTGSLARSGADSTSDAGKGLGGNAEVSTGVNGAAASAAVPPAAPVAPPYEPSAPPPAPAPAAAPVAVAPVAAARSRAAPLSDRAMAESTPSTTALSRDWTTVDVTFLGRNERLARSEAQALVDKVLEVLAANPASRTNAAEGVPMMSLQLLDARGTLAQFDLWNSAYKWRRLGQADVLGQLSPEAVAGLLAELARSLPK